VLYLIDKKIDPLHRRNQFAAASAFGWRMVSCTPS